MVKHMRTDGAQPVSEHSWDVDAQWPRLEAGRSGLAGRARTCHDYIENIVITWHGLPRPGSITLARSLARSARG